MSRESTRSKKNKEGRETKQATHAKQVRGEDKKSMLIQKEQVYFRPPSILALALRINVSASSVTLKKKSFSRNGELVPGVFGCVLVLLLSFLVGKFWGAALEMPVVSILAGR
jgi:hypothetical protein